MLVYHDVLIDSLTHIAMTDEIKVSAHICTRLLIAHFALNLVNSTYEVYSLNAHTIIAWC